MDYLQYFTKSHNSTIYECKTVLNLIINGLPSIYSDNESNFHLESDGVLNLIINGLPSIYNRVMEFKRDVLVLNLIINGLPSIFLTRDYILDLVGSTF